MCVISPSSISIKLVNGGGALYAEVVLRFILVVGISRSVEVAAVCEGVLLAIITATAVAVFGGDAAVIEACIPMHVCGEAPATNVTRLGVCNNAASANK